MPGCPLEEIPDKVDVGGVIILILVSGGTVEEETSSVELAEDVEGTNEAVIKLLDTVLTDEVIGDSVV